MTGEYHWTCSNDSYFWNNQIGMSECLCLLAFGGGGAEGILEHRLADWPRACRGDQSYGHSACLTEEGWAVVAGTFAKAARQTG